MIVNSEGVESKAILPIAIDSPKKTINSLPEDLLKQIFSLLSKKDLQATVLVNRNIRSSVIAAASFNALAKVENFISVLMSPKIFPVQRKTTRLEILEFRDLGSLKECILGVKAQLIEVIKTLDTETANHLRDHVHLPDFFENIFELSAFERRIDQANLIPNEDRRWDALRDISNVLTQAGNINRAIEVATSIPNEDRKWDALQDISNVLTQAGNINRAIEVATSIPNEDRRWDALRDIFNVLTQAGKIDRAIDVAKLFPNEKLRWYALRDISKALTQEGKIDRAIAVATSIPNEKQKRYAIQKIEQMSPHPLPPDLVNFIDSVLNELSVSDLWP